MKKNISNQKREANYDLLRIVCAITIIACHVSATYKAAITDPDIFGKLYSEHLPTIIIYNTLSRFAVPCFMMLSGAFLVSNNNNIHFKNFYKKSYHSIVIPTIIFSIFYLCFSEVISVLIVFV
ncbi:MAG: acyltransferase [Lachnospiraceae bacterium]|nr:acyltransferase [Lachnospiraceae bacterium]